MISMLFNLYKLFFCNFCNFCNFCSKKKMAVLESPHFKEIVNKTCFSKERNILHHSSLGGRKGTVTVSYCQCNRFASYFLGVLWAVLLSASSCSSSVDITEVHSLILASKEVTCIPKID